MLPVKQKLFLIVALFAAAGAVASAQIDTGNTGGTQEHSTAPETTPAPESTGGANDDYSGAGAEAAPNASDSATLIRMFSVCLDRALYDLKHRHYPQASTLLNACLGQNGDPLAEDPTGVVPNTKLAEAYYARGLARAHLPGSSKTNASDSAEDFRKALGLDPSIGARMAKIGFPRKS
jgi:hypothetical protein